MVVSRDIGKIFMNDDNDRHTRKIYIYIYNIIIYFRVSDHRFYQILYSNCSGRYKRGLRDTKRILRGTKRIPTDGRIHMSTTKKHMNNHSYIKQNRCSIKTYEQPFIYEIKQMFDIKKHLTST